jgi:hypothetical protein
VARTIRPIPDTIRLSSSIIIPYAHVKHVVGELEHGSNDFFKRFSHGFPKDTSPELEGSERRRQLVL